MRLSIALGEYETPGTDNMENAPRTTPTKPPSPSPSGHGQLNEEHCGGSGTGEASL